MNKSYFDKAAGRELCDFIRKYTGDSRHRRRKQYVKALAWSMRLVIKC